MIWLVGESRRVMSMRTAAVAEKRRNGEMNKISRGEVNLNLQNSRNVLAARLDIEA